MKKNILFITLIFLSISLFGQKEANHWIIGWYGTDIDFGTTPPNTTSTGSGFGKFFTYRAAASISSPSGELLFYSSADSIWNKNNNIMQNGGGLFGDHNFSQGALIVPLPGSKQFYYVFTIARAPGSMAVTGIAYSIVDMTLDGGLGGVAAGSKNVLTSKILGGKLTAIRHSNGIDLWIIVHEAATNNYLSYLLTPLGFDVNQIPVVSSIGSIEGSNPLGYGCLKPSNDGSKIAAAHYSAEVWELFDFDKTTGVPSNLITIPAPVGKKPYDISFSPNDSLLYGSASGVGTNQWNLFAGSPAAIIASGIAVGSSSSGLQLGPDGKIYCVNSRWANKLDIIKNPNGLGASCNYADSSLRLKSPVDLVLPNIPMNIFYTAVWPGDANHDSLVNNFDLLPIGLQYSQTGSPRKSTSNLWQGYSAKDWGTNQSNGSDFKHTDCNGDGIVDKNDTLAINLNFNSMHTLIANDNDNGNKKSVTPDIYIVPSQSSYNAGDWVDAELWVGTSTLPITNLYGIAFNITYNASVVQPGTESITYPSSWLGIPGTDAIKIAKIDALTSIAYGAVTRIDHTNANGYGKIADFKFQTKASIPASQIIQLSVSGYKANDSNGSPIVFNTPSGSITINPLGTGIATNNSVSGFAVSPNPFTSETTITFRTEQRNTQIKIMDMLGKEIKMINFTGKQLLIEKEEMPKGIYFVQVIDENKNVVNTKIVKQ